jgi:dolichol-phosphate mannosyltransferase
MYEALRVLAVVPVFDEEHKIGSVLQRIPTFVDEVVVVDDGSTDRSREVAASYGATVLSMSRTVGVGAALRAGYEYGAEGGFDVVVVMAGNNKDAPEEIPLLLEPMVRDGAQLVQGSRWLKRDRNFGPMPTYRKLATRLHPLLFSVVARRRITDSTNGFRAVSVALLRDERLGLQRPALDGYELEPYLLLTAIRLGYVVVEVPVTKTYPPRHVGQTKMRPLVDWWAILRPVVLSTRGVTARGADTRRWSR